MISTLNSFLVIAYYTGGLYFFTKKNETMERKRSGQDIDPMMLCKFVVDGSGKKIGESVSVDHDVLIVKAGSRFLGVPMKHVEPAEKTLVVKGLLDVTKAYELGEKWRKESFREMTGHDNPEKDEKRR
jgi:hypothetical protein